MLLITVKPSYDFDLELQKSRSDYVICLKIKIQFKVIPWEVVLKRIDPVTTLFIRTGLKYLRKVQRLNRCTGIFR